VIFSKFTSDPIHIRLDYREKIKYIYTFKRKNI
jgi:hypothetical protein